MRQFKILLAEPNELLRTVLVDRLRMESYDIIAVENGQQLVDEVNQTTVDIIITEELLPFRNGMEIIELATSKSIPVIIISDADLEEKILEAFRLGAADFIDKPFSPNEVVARTKNILNKLNQNES